MARRRNNGALPHARYGVDLTKVPDTYIEPFVAYRAWNWDEAGITSLNAARWQPKVAFEAQCQYRDDWKSMVAACDSEKTRQYWMAQEHHCPSSDCSCGMYAGINMQHLIDIDYIQRGIHGEVHLWGRLERCTLGWRAQYAYPKFFVVPVNMIPMDMTEAQKRLEILIAFGVDIYLQPAREAKVGQEQIPLWINDYGYSSQGLDWLMAKRAKWYTDNPNMHTLAKGDRVAVFGGSNGGGIGIVTEIKDGEMYYTMFTANVIYHKKVSDVKWNEKNWRWETNGTGFSRTVRLEQAMTR